jgi:hypothetical protein
MYIYIYHLPPVCHVCVDIRLQVPAPKCLLLYFLKLICNLDERRSSKVHNVEITDFHPGIAGF